MTLSHHLQVGTLIELLRGWGQDGFQGCTWVSLIRTTLQGDLICRSVDARHQDPISDEWRKDLASLLTATFAFYRLASNAGAASGSFAITGSYSGNRVTLRPVHWVQQPFGYEMVSLEGQVSGPNFSGSIISPGCSTFSLSSATPARVVVVTSGFSQ